MVDENSFIGLLEIFDVGNDVLFPSLKLATDFFVICKFEKDLLREVISPEPVLIVSGFGPLFGRLHKKRLFLNLVYQINLKQFQYIKTLTTNHQINVTMLSIFTKIAQIINFL